MKPPIIPNDRMDATKAMMALGFSIEDIMAISGRLAPVPPITNAMAAPIPIPFVISIFSRGRAISILRYNGTPMKAARGIAAGLLLPRYRSTHASGTKKAHTALMAAPSSTYGIILLKRAMAKSMALRSRDVLSES